MTFEIPNDFATIRCIYIPPFSSEDIKALDKTMSQLKNHIPPPTPYFHKVDLHHSPYFTDRTMAVKKEEVNHKRVYCQKREVF